MKKVFFKVKTTGLDTNLCAIHQLTYCIEVNGKVMENGYLNIKPHFGAMIAQDALNIGNLTEDDLNSYPEPKDQLLAFEEFLGKHVDKFDSKDKYHLIGWNNIKFDDDFLRNFFKRNGNEYFGSWFYNNSIDVMSVAGDAMANVRGNMNNFRLNYVAEYLNLTNDKLSSNPVYPLYLLREIYKKCKINYSI